MGMQTTACLSSIRAADRSAGVCLSGTKLIAAPYAADGRKPQRAPPNPDARRSNGGVVKKRAFAARGRELVRLGLTLDVIEPRWSRPSTFGRIFFSGW